MPRLFNFNKEKLDRTPWKEWDFDEDFFRSLSNYSNEDPSLNTLDGVIDAIINDIESSNPLTDLIPCDPFPARDLVFALRWLINLGFKVSRAKKNTYEFAKKVAVFVDAVKTELNGDGAVHHRFTLMTRRNLGKLQVLLSEICSWAFIRSKDEWNKIENGLQISKEIEDFKTFLEETEMFFTDLSPIHLSGGMKNWAGRIGNLIEDIYSIPLIVKSRILFHDKIINETRKVRTYRQVKMGYIMNEIDKIKQGKIRRAFLERQLDNFVPENPTLNEDRRNAVIFDIMQWFEATTPGSQNFLWLTGDLGCDKAAITAGLTEFCANNPEQVLLTQFFINGNNKKTTDPNIYFSSITRQLSNDCSEVEQAMYDRLRQTSSPALCMTYDQATNLFIDALKVASNKNKRRIVAVIIDNIDETEKKHLHATAAIFSQIFNARTLYPNVKVFISSRSDDDILSPFAHNLKDANLKQVHLTSSAYNVELYLRRKVGEIVERNDLNWEVWPKEERMNKLGLRASGNFIWAATVARYLQQRIDEDGPGCLDGVLNDLTGDKLGDINSLYSMILRNLPTDWDFEKFRQVIGAVIVLREPLCLDDLTGLLHLHHGLSNDDIVNLVTQLRSVLVPGTDAVDGGTVPSPNKSFFEFITNSELFPGTNFKHHPQFYVNLAISEANQSFLMLSKNTC